VKTTGSKEIISSEKMARGFLLSTILKQFLDIWHGVIDRRNNGKNAPIKIQTILRGMLNNP